MQTRLWRLEQKQSNVIEGGEKKIILADIGLRTA